MSTDETVITLGQRLLQAADEVAQHERAREMPDARPPEPAPDSTPPRPRAQPRATAQRPPRPKRVFDPAPLPKLLALLSDSEGLPTRDLAADSGASSAQVLGLLKEQETAGNVRRSGTGGSTRWHLVTDEDRIAARAAELAAQSTSTS